MVTEITGVSLTGLQGQAVAVLAEPSSHFTVHAPTETASREARVRVAAALDRLGVTDPKVRITLPAADDALDLPAAVAALVALGELPAPEPTTAFVGALGLDGKLHAVRGALARALAVREVIVPGRNAAEAALASGTRVLTAETLEQVYGDEAFAEPHAVPHGELTPEPPRMVGAHAAVMHEIGQLVRRGPAKILLVGPPGAGKTTLARWAHSLLSAPSADEVIELNLIYGVAGLVPDRDVVHMRPFRAPHHTVSEAGLVGGGPHSGGPNPRPGEVTLAHLGTLFLDEIVEFRRAALASLGSVLDAGRVVVARARAHVEFPAEPLLVIASANHCACGYAGSAHRTCRCSEQSLARHQQRLQELAVTFDFDATFEVPELTVRDMV